MFPREQGLNLVRMLLNAQPALSGFTDLEQEALVEVGNIILNSCFGTVTNQLKFEVDIGIPEFVQGNPRDIIQAERDDCSALFLEVHFTLPSSNIEGFVTFVMDINCGERFSKAITEFVARVLKPH